MINCLESKSWYSCCTERWMCHGVTCEGVTWRSHLCDRCIHPWSLLPKTLLRRSATKPRALKPLNIFWKHHLPRIFKTRTSAQTIDLIKSGVKFGISWEINYLIEGVLKGKVVLLWESAIPDTSFSFKSVFTRALTLQALVSSPLTLSQIESYITSEGNPTYSRETLKKFCSLSPEMSRASARKVTFCRDLCWAQRAALPPQHVLKGWVWSCWCGIAAVGLLLWINLRSDFLL